MYETYKAYIPTAGDSTVFISAYYDYHYRHHHNHNHYYYMYAKNLLVSYTFCTRYSTSQVCVSAMVLITDCRKLQSYGR